MSALRRALVRLRGLVRRSTVDAELDEELRYHLDRDVSQRVAAGASPADAMYAARRQFGNATRIAEEARESWQVGWFERLGQDVRYALRGFRRAPAFVATVVLTIGIGLGLLTAAFTIFDTYVLRTSPVRDPRGLYEVWFQDRVGHSRAFSWNEYVAMRENNPVFDEVFAYRWMNSRLDGQPIVMQGVSGNYFTALSVAPAFGRVLLPSDATAPGAGGVVVLSYTAWAGRFA
ncbi:MAG: permease prefix domain 1-containing protein, partial [Gemmatimonadaceae bacterium]